MTEAGATNDDCRRMTLEHLEQGSTVLNDVSTSIQLLRAGIEIAPRLLPPAVFSNVVAAEACFVRAYRLVYACMDLLMIGHYGSLGALLRAAYEAGLLGRHLAKEPELADKWLKEGAWVPPGGTRKWMKDTDFLGLDDKQAEIYAINYRMLSAAAHPTAQACLPEAVITDDDEILWQLDPAFDAERFDFLLLHTGATALFCCFALRNAAAHPVHIDPQWHQRLAEVAERLGGSPLPHLNLDWSEERREYQRLMDAVRDASELEDFLDNAPTSSRNLLKRLEHQPNSDGG